MRRGALSLVLVACGSYGSSDPGPSSSSSGASGGPGNCDQAVLYVSSKGDDANAGCDPKLPKRTLTSAIGAVQAKGSPAEIRTCNETLTEHVVLAYPASIVGGFDCTSWARGTATDKTTLAAPPDAVETLIAFGGPVDGRVRLERLRVVGATRPSGSVSALRFKDGAAPVVRHFEVAGGSTDEGLAFGVSIESASPTLEDGLIDAGRARCTKDCANTIATGIAIRGGDPRLRRLRISGGEADVVAAGPYVGSIALDIVGPSKAVDADAYSALEIVHGVGRVAETQPAWGMRVMGGATIDLVDSKIVPSTVPSTCVSTPCSSAAIYVSGATARVRRSRLVATNLEGAPGTSNVVTVQHAAFASSGTLEIDSSFALSPAFALSATLGRLSVSGSTILGSLLIANSSSTVDVESSVLGLTKDAPTSAFFSACQGSSKTQIDSSTFVGISLTLAFLTNQGGTCTGSTAPTLAEAGAKSDSNNAFVATSTWRVAASCAGENAERCIAKAACTDPAACLGEVFASTAPLDGFRLKDGVPCVLAQRGTTTPATSTDAFGTARTMPFSMGAHEYDGACSN